MPDVTHHRPSRLLVTLALMVGALFVTSSSAASAPAPPSAPTNVFAECDGNQHRIPGDVRASATSGYLDASILYVHRGTGWNGDSMVIAWRGQDGTSWTTFMRMYFGIQWTNYVWHMDSPPGYIPGMSYGHSPGLTVTAGERYALTLWNWGSDNMRWYSTEYSYVWSAWTWDQPINASTWSAVNPPRYYADWGGSAGIRVDLFQGSYAGGGAYYVDYKCGSANNGDHRLHG